MLGEGVKTNTHKNARWLEPRGIYSLQSRIDAEGREAGTQALRLGHFCPLMARASHCCSLLPGGRAGCCEPFWSQLLSYTRSAGSRTTDLPDLGTSANLKSSPETQHLRSLSSFQNSVSLSLNLARSQRSKFTQWLPKLHTATHMAIPGYFQMP